jgi:hypothetical protein
MEDHGGRDFRSLVPPMLSKCQGVPLNACEGPGALAALVIVSRTPAMRGNVPDCQGETCMIPTEQGLSC